MKPQIDLAVEMNKMLHAEDESLKQYDKVTKALDALNDAAKCFENVGDIKTARAVTSLIERIAHRKF